MSDVGSRTKIHIGWWEDLYAAVGDWAEHSVDILTWPREPRNKATKLHIFTDGSVNLRILSFSVLPCKLY